MKKKVFYGWVIVGCCFLITAVPMVFLSNTFSYYQVPICSDLGVNYVAFNVSTICSSFAGMLYGLLFGGRMAKGNTRLYMLAGGAVAAAGMFVQSFVTQIWQLYITFFIATFAFAAMTYVAINLLIANWFVDRKGLATSVAMAGTGVGGALLSKVIANMIAVQGWRFSTRVTALVTLAVAVLVFLVIRNSPQSMGIEPYRLLEKEAPAQGPHAPREQAWDGVTKAQALKTGSFWAFAVMLVCAGILTAGIMTQLPTYLIEDGIDYAAVMALYMGVGIVTKLVVGPLYDKVGLLPGVTITGVAVVLGLAALLLAPSRGVFASLAAVLFSFGLAVGTIAPPLVAGRLFGTKEFGGIYGLVNFFYMGGCMVGPIFASGIRTITGSYTAAWAAFIGVSAVMIAALFLSFRMGAKLRKPC